MTVISARLASALADRYRIERELGEGGMATVYLAQDVKHERKVAVKVLLPELAAVLGAERFLSEIHVTAGLQHPNILPLFDSGQIEGQLFYVMPTTPTFRVVARRTLFSVSDMPGAVPHANYDISPDGRTFVMVRRSPATRIVVLQNLPAIVRDARGADAQQR